MDAHKLMVGALMIAGVAAAQTAPRKAALVGGGDGNRGKCTVEVVVDGTAQVEIRGDSATLRNTGGQTPQWRRFECTGPMPANPANFQFAGVDGRGRQTLARDPRNNGGAAVVEIQDSQGGTEGYTFDLMWGGFQDNRGPGPSNNRPDDRRPSDNRGDFRPDRRIPDSQALDVCRRSIHDQAVTRFRTPNVDLQNVALDNNPGRRDWISGDLVLRKRFGRQEVYHFTCAVNFDNGQVRSAQIDQFTRDTYQRR